MKSVSIIGCGYTGQRLAEQWINAGATVRGFAKRHESLRRIAAIGAESVPLDLDAPITPADFSGQLVYYAVPPALNTDDTRLQRFLSNLLGTPKRVIYLSTTGVYGNQAGAKVNEDTPPAPGTQRAARRLSAETTLRAWADGRQVSWCILRVAGIYGPDRLPIERLRRGEPAIREHEATPSNRIHVSDLVTACMVAGSAAAANRRIYNVTDGTEESLTAYLLRVARIADLPPPPLVTRAVAQQTFSASSWSFLAESRRVDNRRVLEELGLVLEYQDLDVGIRASLNEVRHLS
jgi:nucleoside-diphosphate-sugar epimerase